MQHVRAKCIALGCSLVLAVLPKGSTAQVSSVCQETLEYMSPSIPTTGYAPLDQLRQQLLSSNMHDVMRKMSEQNMSTDQAIGLANQQADADASTLPSLEQTIRGGAYPGQADRVMHGLKTRDYSAIGFQEDVVGAAERAYVAGDWGELANRETARQLNCFSLQANGRGSDPQATYSAAENGAVQPVGAPYQPISQAGGDRGATSGPTLEETSSFIQGRMSLEPITTGGSWTGERNNKIQINWEWTTDSIRGCTVKAGYSSTLFVLSDRQKGTSNLIPYESTSQTDRFYELQDYDPNAVAILSEAAQISNNRHQEGVNVKVDLTNNLFLVQIQTTSALEQVSKTEGKPDVHTKKPLTAIIFATNDMSIAARMAKAISHAITLCGGKAEAF